MDVAKKHLPIANLVESDRVHKRVYTDPMVFEKEMENVFGKAWVYVGHESQVSRHGDYFTTTIGTEAVIVVRHVDDSIRVLYNRCPHRGARLTTENNGHVSDFRCIYHGWTFATDGEVKAIPLEAGYEGSSFGRCNSESNIKPVPCVSSYRGFVFARLVQEGPDLLSWLGATRSSFDNLCDRSPEGELQVVGKPLLYENPCNWKILLENITDNLHALPTHQSVSGPAKLMAKRDFANDELPMVLGMLAPFGSPYSFFESMQLTTAGNGHCYAGGANIHSGYEEDPEYLAAMREAYDEDTIQQILGLQRQNTVVYPSIAFKCNLQTMRVFRPISVNKTVLETWTFRLKGAPDEMLKRSVIYNKTLFSPSSMAAHDDGEAFCRIQQALEGDGHDWVSMHRYPNDEKPGSDGTVVGPGTSDLPLRHQYGAWRAYMAETEGEP